MAKCWICGKTADVTSERYENGKHYDAPDGDSFIRCYCNKCIEDLEKKEKENRDLYIKLKKHEMFIKACNILEKQGTPMYEYKEAIDAVEEVVEEKPDKFDSSYEVLAAIILVKNEIYSRMQYKIGRYQVDFLLPDMHIVLEIDGERHRHKRDYDKRRDSEIKKALGPDWEIIRISTDGLDKKATAIPRAIREVLYSRERGRVDWRRVYN